MTLSLVLAGILLGGLHPWVQGTVQEGAATPVLLPGQPGYELKRARELVDLAKCRDAAGRMDLLLSHMSERLREREALGDPHSPEGGSVARGLGDSYRRLALDGGAGALECGVAEGRDMEGSKQRYLEQIRRQHDPWVRVLSRLSPEERPQAESVLRVADEAPERARAAETAGLDFLKKERARRESAQTRPAERSELPPPPPPPPPPPGPAAPSRTLPETTKVPTDPDPSKTDPDHSKKEDGENSHPDHHSHPHRPHH